MISRTPKKKKKKNFRILIIIIIIIIKNHRISFDRLGIFARATTFLATTFEMSVITNDRKNECVSLHCERQNGEQQDEKQEAIHRGPMTFRWNRNRYEVGRSRAAKQTNNRVGYCSFIARRNPYHQLHVWSHDAIVLLDDSLWMSQVFFLSISYASCCNARKKRIECRVHLFAGLCAPFLAEF